MNYIQNNKKIIGKRKLETAPGLHLDEAVWLRIQSYCINMKPNEIKTKHATEADSLR